MNKEPVQAFGNYYFEHPQLPIAVATVKPSLSHQHAHDFTTVDHYHDFSELVVITSGSGIQIIDSTAYDVSVGDVFLIQGHSTHHFVDRSTVGMINIQFNPTRLSLPESIFRQIPGYNVIFQLEPALRDYKGGRKRLRLEAIALNHVEKLARLLHGELTAAVPGYEAMVLGLFWELIVFVSRHYTDSPPPNHAALLRMGEVISEIEQHYASPLTLKRLSAISKTSPNHLLRLFKAATGDSPIHYLLKVRLRHAAEMLRTSDLSIGEIAIVCGFYDSNDFAKKFRTFYHQTPRTCRQGR